MAKVTDIQDKNGVSKEVQDKDLSQQTAVSAVGSTDYVMLQDTSGGYHKIAKASFTEAVRDSLGSVINSVAKGTDIAKVPVLDSNNDLGMGTLANLASVLGVGEKVKIATVTGTTSSNGNMTVNGLSSRSSLILSAVVVNSETSADNCTVATPYRYSSSIDGPWGFHCVNDSDGAVRANKEYTIRYAYIEL